MTAVAMKVLDREAASGVAEPRAWQLAWLGDAAACVCISLVSLVAIRFLYLQLLFLFHVYDLWFDADLCRYYHGHVDPAYDGHCRSNVHPVFPLLMYPARPIAALLQLSRDQAIKVIIQLSALLWCNALYLCLRALGRPRGVALVFTGIGFASAAGLFFLPVPESYALGSVTMLMCIAVFAAQQRGWIADWWLVPAAAATLCLTVTNFMVGVAALLLAFGFRKGTQAAINAFFIVAMLTVVQHLLFPHARSFLNLQNESTHAAYASDVTEKIEVLLCHGVVIPEPDLREVENWGGVGMRLQGKRIFDHNAVGGLALALWLVVLGTAAVLAYWRWPIAKTDLLLGAAILGQIGLHLLYGQETFLYSLHYVPLLVVLASGAACRSRVLLGLSVVLLGLMCWNNYEAFALSRRLLENAFPNLPPAYGSHTVSF